MTPPELAGDVPVGRRLERLDREAVLRLRVVADAAGAQRLERGLLQLLHRAPPLERDQRLDPALATLAERNGVPVRLPPLDQSALLAPIEHALARLLLAEPGELARLLVHPAVLADHHRLRPAAATADLPGGPGGARRPL